MKMLSLEQCARHVFSFSFSVLLLLCFVRRMQFTHSLSQISRQTYKNIYKEGWGQKQSNRPHTYLDHITMFEKMFCLSYHCF